MAGQDKTRNRSQSSLAPAHRKISCRGNHRSESCSPALDSITILPGFGGCVNDKRTAYLGHTEREPGGFIPALGGCPALAVFAGLEVLHPPRERALFFPRGGLRGLAAGKLFRPLGRGPWPGGTSRGIARSTRSKLREGGWVVAACAMLKTADTQAAAPAMPSEPKRAKRGLTAEALRTRRTVSGPAWASRARRTR